MKTEDNHDNSADIEFYAGTGDNIIESKMRRFHWRQQQEASLTQSATGRYQSYNDMTLVDIMISLILETGDWTYFYGNWWDNDVILELRSQVATQANPGKHE